MAGTWYTAEVGAGMNGVGVTAANSDDGTAGDALATNIAAGNTITFDTASAIHGTYGLRFARVSGTLASYVQIDMGAGHPRESVTIYFHYDGSTPPGNWGIFRLRNSAIGIVATLFLTAAKKLQLQNSAGGQLYLQADTLAAGDYRIEINAEPGASSTTGKVEFRFFTATGDTALGTLPLVSNANLGTVKDVRFLELGRVDSSGGVGAIGIDTPGYEPLSAGWLGKFGAAALTPQYTVTPQLNVNLLDSEPSPANGALSFGSPTHVSGPTLSYVEVVDGFFAFTALATGGASVYDFPVTEAGATTVMQRITIPNVVPGTTALSRRKRWIIDGPLPTDGHWELTT